MLPCCCVGCRFSRRSTPLPTDAAQIEKRLGELLPCWMGRLLHEEEYKKFKCVFEEKPNGLGGKWTLASMCEARVSGGNLLRRCKENILKPVVNICQVAFNEFCTA